MSRRHHRLDGVCCRRFTGAVTAGKQIDRAEIEFSMGDITPVDVDEFFQVHAYSSLSIGCPSTSTANTERPPLWAKALSSGSLFIVSMLSSLL